MTDVEVVRAEAAPPPAPALPPPAPAAALPPPRAPLVFDPLAPYRGTVRRFFTVYRHVFGLLSGGAVAYVDALPRESRRGLRQFGPRLAAFVVRPFIARELRALPFPVQLRRRLELLGPTYIKFGQILAIREDLLPEAVTQELQNLFDRLPAIPFAEVRAIIERSLGLPLAAVFAEVSPEPIGSASIAQAHLARLSTGERAVVKVIKPGIPEVIDYDLRLLAAVGRLLERVIPRYTPRQVIAEFAAYTRREVDYTFEADNAETFASNFADTPGIRFPRIYREASAKDVLTMEYFDGFKPTSAQALALPEAERQRVIDLGAEAIVRMLYQDGFFHADLHAGNLMILPTRAPAARCRSASSTSAWSAASRSARGGGCCATSTRSRAATSRTRPATSRTWRRCSPAATSPASALARRPVAPLRDGHAPRQLQHRPAHPRERGLGARHGVSFPVEMTLMVKALVTFEGVGRTLDPRSTWPAVSRGTSRGVPRTFSPARLSRELWRARPRCSDLAVQLPGSCRAASASRARPSSAGPTATRSPACGRASSAARSPSPGVLAYVQHAPWWLWAALWTVAAAVCCGGSRK
jgi:ubiquinone biosynthesis protein